MVANPPPLVWVGPADERAGYPKGQARSGRDGAGLVRDADGSRAVGDRVPERHLQRPDRTPRFPATTPEVAGPPEPRSFRCVLIPLPVPAGFSVSPPEPLGRTAVTLAPAPAVVCATGHRSTVIFDTGPASDEPAECVGVA